MSTKSNLRIAVIGAGRIGSAFAFNLKRIGQHEVTAIARPGSARLKQLQRDNGITTSSGEHAEVGVLDELDEKIPYDLIIVTLLAHQVETILPALKRSCAKTVLFMFNNFDSEWLQDAIGIERAAFGMPFIQADFTEDGKLKAIIGANGQKSLVSQQQLVDVFLQSELPAVLEPKMHLWLRCHAPMAVAFESVSIKAVRRGNGATFAQSMVLAKGVHQAFSLIKSLGHPIYPAPKIWLDRSPVWVLGLMLFLVSRIKSFRELLATGVLECRALVDAMVTAATKANLLNVIPAIRAMKPEEF